MDKTVFFVVAMALIMASFLAMLAFLQNEARREGEVGEVHVKSHSTKPASFETADIAAFLNETFTNETKVEGEFDEVHAKNRLTKPASFETADIAAFLNETITNETKVEGESGEAHAKNHSITPASFETADIAAFLNETITNETKVEGEFDEVHAKNHSTKPASFETADIAVFLNETITNETKVIRYNGIRELRDVAFGFFQGKMCRTFLGNDTADDHPHTLIDINFNCQDMFKNGDMGSGNYIGAFYAARAIARTLGNMDLTIHCDDAEENHETLLLPWVMGTFGRSRPSTWKNVTFEDVCVDKMHHDYVKGYSEHSFLYLFEDLRFEMRRLAIAMVGVPEDNPSHPSHAWAAKYLWGPDSVENYADLHTSLQIPPPAEDDLPVHPNVTLDEAVIHFRCGDIIDSNHPAFGFMKFDSFTRHLAPDVKTIGVCTQPFPDDGDDEHQVRKGDRGGDKARKCKMVVMAFIDHVHEKFPNATVSIHNGPTETIPLAYARMIMANQTVIAISSFGVFPGISTFGTGYLRKPDYRKAPNQWLLDPPIEELTDNVHLVKEPRLTTGAVKGMWRIDDGKTVLEWFRNYTMPPLS